MANEDVNLEYDFIVSVDEYIVACIDYSNFIKKFGYIDVTLSAIKAGKGGRMRDLLTKIIKRDSKLI